MKKLGIIAAFLLLIAVAMGLAQTYRWPNMTTVQKVWIDKLGNNDDAERFRFQLAIELGKNGFTAWDGADGADGVVKGTFSYKNFSDKSGASANLRVMSADNKEIWGLSVSDPKVDRKGDSSLWVAQEVAKRMREQKANEVKWFKGKK